MSAYFKIVPQRGYGTTVPITELVCALYYYSVALWQFASSDAYAFSMLNSRRLVGRSLY